MARKSNKTAHVLNLLSGHDAKRENEEEVLSLENASSSEDSLSSEDAGAVHAPGQAGEPPQASDTPEPPAPQVSSSVSVVDATETDPLAELIQEKLLEELNMTVTAEPSLKEPASDPETIPVVPPEPEPAAEPEVIPDITSPDEPEPPAKPEPVPEAQPEPEPEPEPDFVTLNVIERIVREKVIYFMRQFDVCDCDRCIADTVALTLNGLAPKYVVTTPMAVDPLMSFYTNKFIADITVEATKACMIVKEHPRH